MKLTKIEEIELTIFSYKYYDQSIFKPLKTTCVI